MDFQQLLAKMAELDQPAVEAVTTETAAIDECPGNPMPGDTATLGTPATSNDPSPSMSINLNAQGLDNIEEIMKLVAKVNPDAAPAAPSLPIAAPAPVAAPAPSALGDLGNLDAGPLKMLPDLDANDAGDDKPELPTMDLDKDEQEPSDDQENDQEDDEEDDEKKEWANSLDDSEPEVKDVDYMNNKLAGGMNRPKDTFPKVAGGDNPMQRSRIDTRESIRAELLKRLAEAKGAK